jgi:hypothetical protein
VPCRHGETPLVAIFSRSSPAVIRPWPRVKRQLKRASVNWFKPKPSAAPHGGTAGRPRDELAAAWEDHLFNDFHVSPGSWTGRIRRPGSVRGAP